MSMRGDLFWPLKKASFLLIFFSDFVTECDLTARSTARP